MSFLAAVFTVYMIAAPAVYGMNDKQAGQSADRMLMKAVATGMTGSVFSPAAFAKMCAACTQNACVCCGEKCGSNCKMNGGKENGN